MSDPITAPSSTLNTTSSYQTSPDFNTSTNFNTGSTSGISSTTGTQPTTADTVAAKASATLQNARDTVVAGAQTAAEKIQAHPTYQQLSSGPLAENVRAQANLTSSEFQDLKDARRPGAPAATGQPLTNYHSLFYRLLSWRNPRATGLVFAMSAAFIILTRYLNVLHYVFKFSYIVLGITASLEIAGKLLFDDGLASKMRPRKYYTIPKQSLEAALDDVEQLLNFFVIESQRILYAENVYATVAVFLAALMSFGLIKIMPFWGLALMADIVVFLGPLVYIKNREVIDHQVEHMQDVVSAQTAQLRDVAAHHASVAAEQVKTYTHEYTAKAQELVGRKTSAVNSQDLPVKTSTVSSQDFPAAPRQEPVAIRPMGTQSAAVQPVAGQPVVVTSDPLVASTTPATSGLQGDFKPQPAI